MDFYHNNNTRFERVSSPNLQLVIKKRLNWKTTNFKVIVGLLNSTKAELLLTERVWRNAKLKSVLIRQLAVKLSLLTLNLWPPHIGKLGTFTNMY